MAITNTWFAAMREIKVPTGNLGLMDASQKMMVQATSPLVKSVRRKGKPAAAAPVPAEEKVVKEALILQTQAIDLTLINDCYGTGEDKVRDLCLREALLSSSPLRYRIACRILSSQCLRWRLLTYPGSRPTPRRCFT